VAGFQLAEVKAEKLKHEATVTEGKLTAARTELQELTASRESLQRTLADLRTRVAGSQKELAGLADELGSLRGRAQTQQAAATLQDLEQKVSALDIDLRSGALPVSRAGSGPLDSVIRDLFGATAAVRGAAYEELVSRFAADPELVPRLLAHAKSHPQNHNGIYNTLVVLSRLDHRALRSDVAAIRVWAERARGNGPKTSERVDKLLARLPA
jgi:hypothetical protein